MAYVIIVEDDNSLYGSNKERIMQREKLFNKLWFLVPPYYNDYNMSKCTVTMRYLLPISKEYKTETLVLSKERYEGYLKYILPIDTNLTKEYGDIELNLTFTMVDIYSNGDVAQRVRKTTNHILKITPIPDWDSIVPDSALSALDQRIIKQDIQIQALNSLINTIDNNQVNNIIYNEEEATLQLSSNDIGVGDKISIQDILSDGTPAIMLSDDEHEDFIDSNDIVEF